MSEEQQNQEQPAVRGDPEPDLETAEGRADQIEAALEEYPLRPPQEDPGWAIKTVWIWVVVAVGLFVFLVLLTILGIFFD